MGYGGIGEGDYSSSDGQKHVHHKCICCVPGLLNQVKLLDESIPDNVLKLQEIKQYLLEACPDEFFQEILIQYNKLNNI